MVNFQHFDILPLFIIVAFTLSCPRFYLILQVTANEQLTIQHSLQTSIIKNKHLPTAAGTAAAAHSATKTAKAAAATKAAGTR